MRRFEKAWWLVIGGKFRMCTGPVVSQVKLCRLLDKCNIIYIRREESFPEVIKRGVPSKAFTADHA